jgi:S-phase kinase-associated protein 1
MTILITLQSSDGEQFKTDINVAKKSKTLRTMLEDLGVEEDAGEDEIKEILPLPNMEAFILDKIINWCKDHLTEEEPDLDKAHPDAKDGATRVMRPLTEVEKKWCDGIPEIQEDGAWAMLDLLQSANYLHIPGLIELTSMEVAKRFYNESQTEEKYKWKDIKTPEEIRQIFKIVNDLEDEDEEDAKN